MAHCGQSGTGLGPGALCSSSAMLAPGHSSPEQQNTQKLYGTKNNCERAPLGQILVQKDKKRKKNPTAISEEPGAKMECWKQM